MSGGSASCNKMLRNETKSLDTTRDLKVSTQPETNMSQCHKRPFCEDSVESSLGGQCGPQSPF